VRSLNRTGNRDNMIRARRFDRINRITPGAGDRFPVNYGLLKANFLPTDAIVTPNVLPQLNMFLEVRGPAEAWEIRELEKLTTESGALPSRLLSRNPDEGSYWVSITPRGEMHQVTYWYDHTDPIPIADVRVKSLNDAITVALESRFTHPKFIDPRIRMRYASHNEQTDERANSGRRAGVHEEPERGPTSRVSRTVESGKPFRVQRGDQIAGERAIRSQARQQAATDFARRLTQQTRLLNERSARHLAERFLESGGEESLSRFTTGQIDKIIAGIQREGLNGGIEQMRSLAAMR